MWCLYKTNQHSSNYFNKTETLLKIIHLEIIFIVHREADFEAQLWIARMKTTQASAKSEWHSEGHQKSI